MSRIFVNSSMAVVMALFLLLPSYLAPKKADAIAPAIPVIVGVGAVLATALAVYGVQSVNANHSTSDVAGDFIAWASAELEKGGEVASVLADANIHNIQELNNRLYGMAINGYIDLATVTYNVTNGIASSVDNWLGRLLQLWASDNFGAVSFTTVTFGDYSISTFYSDTPLHELIDNYPSNAGGYNSPMTSSMVLEDGEVLMLSPYGYPAALVFYPNGGWAYSSKNSRDSSPRQWANVYTWAEPVYSSVIQRHITSGIYTDLDYRSIAFNTYYDIYLCVSNTNVNLANPGNSPQQVGTQNIVAHYSASSGTWETMNAWAGLDVSTALPDAIDYGLWSDSKNLYGDASVADVLGQSIPVAADMVYNPTADRVLEGQGSIPVILDWSRVTDWADVLQGTQTGVIDGTRVIDGASSTTAVNTATGSIASTLELDMAKSTPYLSINPNGGSIAGALDFAGHSMLDRFPFCTIRDLQMIGSFLSVDASAPVFDLPVITVDDSGGYHVEPVPIDLSGWEPVAIVIRSMFIVLIILGAVFLAVRQVKVFNEE